MFSKKVSRLTFPARIWTPRIFWKTHPLRLVICRQNFGPRGRPLASGSQGRKAGQVLKCTLPAGKRSLKHIWDLMGSSGIFWDLLGSNGIILKIFGILWDSLGSYGIYWDLLGSFGIFWDPGIKKKCLLVRLPSNLNQTV